MLQVLIYSFLASNNFHCPADKLCKQFGPRSGLTLYKPFGNLILFLKDFFKKLVLKEIDDEKPPSMKSYQTISCLLAPALFLLKSLKISQNLLSAAVMNGKELLNQQTRIWYLFHCQATMARVSLCRLA